MKTQKHSLLFAAFAISMVMSLSACGKRAVPPPTYTDPDRAQQVTDDSFSAEPAEDSEQSADSATGKTSAQTTQNGQFDPSSVLSQRQSKPSEQNQPDQKQDQNIEPSNTEDSPQTTQAEPPSQVPSTPQKKPQSPTQNKPKPSTSPTPNHPRPIEVPTQTDTVPAPNTAPVPMTAAMMAAQNGNLTCATPGQCNPSVVMISSATDNSVIRCSGVLVSEDQVITNDHCIIHSNAVMNNTNCDQQIFVHFLGINGARPRAVSCARIQFRSYVKDLFSKDYAVIQLKEKIKDRAPIKIASRGFYNHESANLIKIQPTNGPMGSLDGVQQSTQCYAAYQTMLYTGIADASSPLMTFGNCPVIGGNSGAPILNSRGEIGALQQGLINMDNQPAFAVQLRELGINPIMGSLAVGTQAACMDFLSPYSALNCQDVVPVGGLLPRDYLIQYSGAFAEKINFPATTQTWKRLTGYTPFNANYVEVPKCIAPQDLGNPAKMIFQVAGYRASINGNYEVEWIRQGQNRFSFQLSGVYSDEAHFTNAQFGNISVPVCH